MSITSHDVPNYEQLLDYVPRNRYDKQAITTSRRETQISATGNNLVQTKFPSTATATFLIPPSTSTLLNLSECYFDIEGKIKVNKDGNTTHDSLPKLSKFWILRCIQNATLKVAGTNIYSTTNPAKYAKFKEMMYYDYDDIKRGNEELNGLPCDVYRQTDGIDDTKVYEAYVVKSSAENDVIIAKSGDPAALDGKMASGKWEKRTFLLEEALSSSKIKELPIEIKTPNNNSYYTVWWIKSSTDKYEDVGFYVHLKLTDLFPIENLKPIFGQQVEIELKTESEGYCGIKLTNALTNQIDSNCGKIKTFDKFRLNAINYQLNIKMIEKLQQIYSKQIVEIIDDYSEYPQQMLGVRAGGTLNVKLPLSINFESDMLYISWPETTGNPEEEKAKAPSDDDADKTLNYWNHTPLENRFMNIQRIEITCDSEIIYSHNYIHDGGIDSGNAADIYKLIGYYQIRSGGSNTDKYVPIGNFLDAYELYKQCRFYCGQSDHGAMSFEEFLTSGFAICLPMSAFSRLSTGSMIELNITFGDGIVQNGEETHIAGINQKWPGRKEIIDTISVIQKSKKAIVFNGYNNCQVKQINQSFEQDIDISEPTPENGAQQ